MFHTALLPYSPTLAVRSCNPLAGIEVFHTHSAGDGQILFPSGQVVIPWRGLRCFTLAEELGMLEDADYDRL